MKRCTTPRPINWQPARWGADVAEVMGVDAQRASLWAQMEGGERQMLDPRHLAARHIRPWWVRTSQGATCDRVIAHLEAFRANTAMPPPPML
ncbi:hypothetical protein [Sphingomonas kyeonggiensis]|uniref:Uncharacterized protein n=1 Tax=Sphingomonas kyeonggiensis TaxID=1268553 RepID=A0A7W6JYS2_9SPHN|nr:hypothetical protein [Sphingomonas kyeonggiensis]MBB4101056.1 hypothetical protein [Sphingomonas kyeonggiensis]